MSARAPKHLVAELERHGVRGHRIEQRGKNPHLIFEWQGREVFFVFPNSVSDKGRAIKNGVSSLRRLLAAAPPPPPANE